MPVDLVIDHSVQVDYAGVADACRRNMDLEMKRNAERYALLRWAQGEFANLRVVPPGAGICHQVNLEYLAEVVRRDAPAGPGVGGAPSATLGRGGFAARRRPRSRAPPWVYPDTVIGTDSHTTMINGLGVLGWGVGGIEAEAVMLGQPYFMLVPQVVGVRLAGRLRPNATATDLVLTITELLRGVGVVNRFVEYFGPGAEALSVPDRATVANMSPEYGATCGFFPVDRETIAYLQADRAPGRALQPGGELLPGAGLVPGARIPRPRVLPGGGVRSGRRAAQSRRSAAPAGPGALEDMAGRFHQDLPGSGSRAGAR